MSGGSQGIGLDASNGPINLTANGAASSFAFTADANAQDLTIALIASPSNNSKVNITSDGNTSGALTLLANNGGITMTAASSYSLTSGTSFNLSGTGASSGMALTSTADGNNLSIVLAGATDSKLRIISSGTNLDAIRMQSSAGGFDIDAVTSYTVDVSAGPISLDAIGASSNAQYIEFQATGVGTGTGIAIAMSTIDCSTYDPLTAQLTVIDCGTYD